VREGGGGGGGGLGASLCGTNSQKSKLKGGFISKHVRALTFESEYEEPIVGRPRGRQVPRSGVFWPRRPLPSLARLWCVVPAWMHRLPRLEEKEEEEEVVVVEEEAAAAVVVAAAADKKAEVEAAVCGAGMNASHVMNASLYITGFLHGTCISCDECTSCDECISCDSCR
jgi:hypothetical protein